MFNDSQSPTPTENISSEVLNPKELSSIFLQLSESPVTNFDAEEINQMICDWFSIIYNTEFLKIDSNELLKNTVLINNSFVKLIKYSQEQKYKNISNLFIVYCDYFNLPYHGLYCALHEKIQLLIKQGAKRLFGIKVFKSFENKLSEKKEYSQKTLFDLI